MARLLADSSRNPTAQRLSPVSQLLETSFVGLVPKWGPLAVDTFFILTGLFAALEVTKWQKSVETSWNIVKKYYRYEAVTMVCHVGGVGLGRVSGGTPPPPPQRVGAN